MVHGEKRIPYWIDRELTGLAGPEYHAIISFGLPLSLKTPNMGNPGVDGTIYRPPRSTKLDKIKNLHSTDSIDTENSGTRGRSI